MTGKTLRRWLWAALLASALALFWVTPARADAPTPPPEPAPPPPDASATPEPSPEPSPAPTPATGASGASVNYTLNPEGSLEELVTKLVEGMLGDTAMGFLNMNDRTASAAVRLLTHTLGSGLYTRAGRTFSLAGGILFVPMAILRLVWLQKRSLTGESDSPWAAALDILAAAAFIAGMGPLMDWLYEKTFALSALVFTTSLGQGDFFLPGNANEVLGFMQQGVASLFFGGFVALGELIATLGLAAAFFAIHGMFYVLMALGPIVFALALLPPLQFLRRFWLYGLGGVILAPFVGGAALAASASIRRIDFGTDLLMLRFVIRMVWGWTAAGLVWSLVAMLSRAGLATAVSMGRATLSGITRTLTGVGLMAAGAGAGGLAGALGGMGGVGPLTGGGSGSGGGTPGGTGGGSVLSDAQGGGDDAAARVFRHGMRAAAFQAWSGLPLVGSLARGGAAYHRTLAQAAARTARPQKDAGPSRAQSFTQAFEVYEALTGDPSEARFRHALKRVEILLGNAEDEEGRITPSLWVQYEDHPNASLAGALAAMWSNPKRREWMRDTLKERGPREGWALIRQMAEKGRV